MGRGLSPPSCRSCPAHRKGGAPLQGHAPNSIPGFDFSRRRDLSVRRRGLCGWPPAALVTASAAGVPWLCRWSGPSSGPLSRRRSRRWRRGRGVMSKTAAIRFWVRPGSSRRYIPPGCPSIICVSCFTAGPVGLRLSGSVGVPGSLPSEGRACRSWGHDRLILLVVAALCGTCFYSGFSCRFGIESRPGCWLVFPVNGVVKPHVSAWMLPLRGVTEVGAVSAFSAGGLPGAGGPLSGRTGGARRRPERWFPSRSPLGRRRPGSCALFRSQSPVELFFSLWVAPGSAQGSQACTRGSCGRPAALPTPARAFFLGSLLPQSF